MGPFFSVRKRRAPDPSGKPVGRRNRGRHCSDSHDFLNGFEDIRTKNADNRSESADEFHMESPITPSTRLPKPLVRVLAAGVFLIAFFTLTSLIDPSQSTATESLGTERGETYGPVLGGGDDPTARMLEALPLDATVLGTLEGRHATVIITAGELEARYSVFTPEGEPRVIEATLGEMYEIAPDIDIAGMLAGGQEIDQSVPIDIDGDWNF
jgi:hypothetical protein